MSANTSMPRISAATPMLLMIASSRTPRMLITVVVTSATRPMNDCMSRPGTGEGSLNTTAKTDRNPSVRASSGLIPSERKWASSRAATSVDSTEPATTILLYHRTGSASLTSGERRERWVMARPGRRDLAEDRIRACAASTSISHAGCDGSLRNSNLHDPGSSSPRHWACQVGDRTRRLAAYSTRQSEFGTRLGGDPMTTLDPDETIPADAPGGTDAAQS